MRGCVGAGMFRCVLWGKVDILNHITSNNDYSLSVHFALQYSNMYACLPKVQDLLTKSDLQGECLEYVALPGNGKLASLQS